MRPIGMPDRGFSTCILIDPHPAAVRRKVRDWQRLGTGDRRRYVIHLFLVGLAFRRQVSPLGGGPGRSDGCGLPLSVRRRSSSARQRISVSDPDGRTAWNY